MRYGLALLLSISCAPFASAQSVVSTPVSDRDTEAEEARSAKIDGAIDLITKHDPAGALTALDSVLREYEVRYGADKRRIFCAESEEEAIQQVKEVLPANDIDSLTINTGWCRALWAKGFALIDLSRIDEAASMLEKAVAMWPVHAKYHSELGYAYQMLKRPQDALARYMRAAALADRMEEGADRTHELRVAWFGMGYELIELGRLDEAEAILEKCLKLTPDDEKVASELKYVRDQKEARKKKSS